MNEGQACLNLYYLNILGTHQLYSGNIIGKQMWKTFVKFLALSVLASETFTSYKRLLKFNLKHILHWQL